MTPGGYIEDTLININPEDLDFGFVPRVFDRSYVGEDKTAESLRSTFRYQERETLNIAEEIDK
jgi:hypothetical protein